MTEEVQKPATDIVDDKTANITIGGEIVPINKLKAGKFYEVQKIFTEIVKTTQLNNTQPENKDNTKNTVKETNGEKVQPKDPKDGEHTPNTNTSMPTLDHTLRLIEVMPDLFMKFISICADIPEKELQEKAYPEEIGEAFVVCVKLNNVLENIKNFAAPMEKLGALN